MNQKNGRAVLCAARPFARLRVVFTFIREKLFCQNAEQHCDEHIRQGVAYGNVKAHQKAIEHETNDPENKSTRIQRFMTAVSVQKKKVGDLNCNHGGEYRPNQIEEPGDVVHREDDGTNGAK